MAWFLDVKQMQQYAAQSAEDFGDWAEFGVMEGGSARIFLDCLPDDRKLYLFDWFQGLPESWCEHPAGTYACEVPVFDDPRAVIVQGLFADTLPDWVKNYSGQLSFVHIDCDLYSSTIFVLRQIYPLLTPETLVLFDEINGSKFENHEERALSEFIEEKNIGYRRLAGTPTQRLIRFTGLNHA